MSSSNVLITGGSGFLGNHLRKSLENQNSRVAILSRNPRNDPNAFRWDVEKTFIDPAAIEKTDVIIHLAGASLASGRWTAERKKEIIDSRVKSAELLYETLKGTSHHIKTFVSASGVGVYGDTKDVWADENSAPGTDFPAEVCREWENAAMKIASLGIRTVIIRIGFVLAKNGGALPVLALPVRYFIGSPIGSGKQFLSWIHVNDVCSVFIRAIENENMEGVYNAVVSNPVIQKDFMSSLAKTLHRPLWPLRVPSWFLKLILGEKAEIVLGGQRVSNKKLAKTGFQFQFSELDSALNDILS